jgi:hypothetical protein
MIVFDRNGNSANLQELAGTETGNITRNGANGGLSIRVESSTYISVTGEVYSSSQEKAQRCSTSEYFDYARKMFSERLGVKCLF